MHPPCTPTAPTLHPHGIPPASPLHPHGILTPSLSRPRLQDDDEEKEATKDTDKQDCLRNYARMRKAYAEMPEKLGRGHPGQPDEPVDPYNQKLLLLDKMNE